MARLVSGPSCDCDPAGRAAFVRDEVDSLRAAAEAWERLDGRPRVVRVSADMRMVQVFEDRDPALRPSSVRAVVFEKRTLEKGWLGGRSVSYAAVLDPAVDPSCPTWPDFAAMLGDMPRPACAAAWGSGDAG